MKRTDFRPNNNSSSSISNNAKRLIQKLEAEKKSTTKQDVLSKKEYKKPTTKAYLKGYKDGIEYSEGEAKHYLKTQKQQKHTNRYVIYRYDDTPFENPKAKRYTAKNQKETLKLVHRLNKGKHKDKWVWADTKEMK